MAKKHFIIHTDGGARGNPGPAGIGIVIDDAISKERFLFNAYIGETTNNQAEYQALIYALKKADELNGEEVLCYLDSELVVRQMKKEYRVKDAGLAPLFLNAWNLSAHFKKCQFIHIPRSLNKDADAQVNKAIDEHLKKKSP